MITTYPVQKAVHSKEPTVYTIDNDQPEGSESPLMDHKHFKVNKTHSIIVGDQMSSGSSVLKRPIRKVQKKTWTKKANPIILIDDDQSESFESPIKDHNQSIFADGQVPQPNLVWNRPIQESPKKTWTKKGKVCYCLALSPDFEDPITCNLCILAIFHSYAYGLDIQSHQFKDALKGAHRTRNLMELEIIKDNERSLDESMQQKMSEDSQRENDKTSSPIGSIRPDGLARCVVDHVLVLDS